MACITANMARECRVERVDKHQLAGGGQGSAGRRSNSVHVQGKPGGKHSCESTHGAVSAVNVFRGANTRVSVDPFKPAMEQSGR